MVSSAWVDKICICAASDACSGRTMETGVGKLKSYKRHTLKIWGLALSGHDGRGSILVSCLVA